MTAEEFDTRKTRTNGHNKTVHIPDGHRLLPQAPQAEQALLSSYLLSPMEVAGLCAQKGLTAEWFHAPGHALMFAEIKEFERTGAQLEIIGLTQFMDDRGTLNAAGGHINGGQSTGAAFVTEVFTYLPTAANAEHYIEILEEKFTLREMIKKCSEFTSRAYEQQDDVPALLNEAEAAICGIANRTRRGSRKSTRDTVMDVIDEITTRDESKVLGISTGFPNLDLAVRGLKEGNMIVIAGATGDGKTSLALNIANMVGVRGVKRGFEGERTRHKVMIFPLEMTQKEVVEALLQIDSSINLDTVVGGTASETEQRHLGEAAVRIGKGLVEIHDESEIDILQIRSIARQHKPRLIILDYAQLAKGSKRKYDRDEAEIAEVSRACKLMAGELGATVIVISQLNDRGKTFGSSSLSKDANQQWIVSPGADDNEKVVVVCKQRRGGRAEVPMRWIGACQKFLPKAV